MVHIVGAGPGAPDLITLRGKELLEQADVVIYAGSLVNPQLLTYTRPECRIYDSAAMTLEQVMEVILQGEEKGLSIVRLHTGDPSIYGAIKEQMDAMDQAGVSYDICPGVSSFCAAAAALSMEYTLPGVSQSVIISRMAGRTPTPERESIRSLASHQTSMVLFLSTGLLEQLTQELLAGGFCPDTPAAIVYKASWPQERVIRCQVGDLAQQAKEARITKTALILVGDAVGAADYQRSKLYDPSFTTEFRKGTENQ